MQVKTHIIRAGDFVRSQPSGELDFEQSKQMLIRTLDAANDKIVCDVLLDLREITAATVGSEGIQELAAILVDFPSFHWRKVAILLPPHAAGMKAAQFQNHARKLGFQVETFKDFEDAIYWLSIIREVAATDLH